MATLNNIQKQAKRAFFTFVIPTSLKRMAVYGVTWFALWPAAGAAVFPRAGTELRPEIVEQLAPGKMVYIRPQNFAGTAHALLQGGPLALPFQLRNAFNSDVEGATSNDWFRRATGVCGVSAKNNDVPTLLHEIRHCSSENMKLMKYGVFSNILVEGDADYHAAKTLSRETGDPRVETLYLYDQAKLGRGAHDTALYLAALFNGRAAPPLDVMERANREAEVTYTPLMNKSLNRSLGSWACQGDDAKVCDYDAKKQGLSPLALERAQLYEQAWQATLAKTEEAKPSSQSRSSAPAP